MKTWNLTKNTEANMGAYIGYRTIPNDLLPVELIEKFMKDNFTLVKSGMYTPSLINGIYKADWVNGYIELHYKSQAGKLLVLFMKSGKQKLYILSVQ